jgi:hypothetical protein
MEVLNRAFTSDERFIWLSMVHLGAVSTNIYITLFCGAFYHIN